MRGRCKFTMDNHALWNLAQQLVSYWATQRRACPRCEAFTTAQTQLLRDDTVPCETATGNLAVGPTAADFKHGLSEFSAPTNPSRSASDPSSVFTIIDSTL